MCALQGRRRTGPFALPEGDPVAVQAPGCRGAPGPRAAGAPFTSMELEKGARRRLEMLRTGANQS